MKQKTKMERWKQGMRDITQLQQIGVQLLFTRIILIGIALGFIATIINYKISWWLSIILAGAFGNTFVQYIALKQKQKLFKELEDVAV